MSQDSVSSVSSVSSTASIPVRVMERADSISDSCQKPSQAVIAKFESALGMNVAALKVSGDALHGGSKKRRKRRKGRRRRGGVTPEEATKGQKLAAGALSIILIGLAAGISFSAIIWVLNVSGYFGAFQQALHIAQAKVTGCGTLQGIAARQAAQATAVKATGAASAHAMSIMTCSEAVGAAELANEALLAAEALAKAKSVVVAAAGGGAAAMWGFTALQTWILSWFSSPDNMDIDDDCPGSGGGGGGSGAGGGGTQKSKITDHFKRKGGSRRRRRRTHRRRRRHRRRTNRRRKRTRHRRRMKRRRTRRRRR